MELVCCRELQQMLGMLPDGVGVSEQHVELRAAYPCQAELVRSADPLRQGETVPLAPTFRLPRTVPLPVRV